jgi:hypothetical protein
MSSGEENGSAARGMLAAKSLGVRVWPWLVALWIAGVLLGFLIIRVAGSRMGEAILLRVGLR